MKGPLALSIGWRFYRARQSNSFISFISFASTAGIALGVAVLIIVLSAMNGFERELEQRLLGVVPQADIVGVDEPIVNWQSVAQGALQIEGIRGAAPFIRMQGLVQKPGGFQGLAVVGIDPKEETKVSTLSQFMSDASWQSLSQDENHIVLGESLLTKLGLEVGDTLALYVQDIDPDAAGSLRAAKSHRFVVSGTYHLGGELELTTAYIPLQYAAQILNMNNGVTGVRISVDKVFDAPVKVRELGYAQKQSVYISDWTRTQGHLYQDIQLVRTVMYLVLVLVIGVACFNIVSTLVMAVRDKASEIAILMTMGLSRLAVMGIFMVQGALNGLLGCGLGGIIGISVALNLSAIASSVEQLLGIQLLSADVYFVDFLPSELHVSDAVLVIVMAFVMSLIATLYPAWKASQIAPAQALAGR
ncbi:MULTISPECIES: lipoprotein-releasing ABC transporter permease subunit LolE [Shewanella]|jgi:lipoprotein-releasing system permease protein|uniref:lipoprotein-releasing ABC transporter permease subunit LolE n=1 Tax=Shewanella TaxID=22 RepID=UPI000CF644DA|nr:MULTISPECIES: lipoprotein-releasing ABC transporter permease subunit LolE [unclassified Shewanella]RBP78473.1 lipoprotein-releasing system permease protein [Shewanella putrefaciens]AVI68081.1 lipoprotein-releasing system transmembrane subunit LolE [Shewanella sp. WE21]MCU7961561.1 lipoprotein-releasing ABC transporter permease subunit LolE [Shewanella sp. SW32]MCU7969643.1 lipoprotein-releasing ABC transporter permease subunit LolE [Shewanella sp. SW29]MCU7987101.1 lipoprotein-releasing ABC